ncbi:MAG TPA: tetratricopeptide repeat protein [Kofleriaceae bacterium]|jgi:tetratricopeptide (TPR) repeat protein|nr:tetratricopeptide repeat protein [Kofleriaceae bacterium]
MKLFAAAALVALVGASGCGRSKGESIKLTNEGNTAYGQKSFETAIERFDKATKLWEGNHTAWYGMGGAYSMRKDWDKSADAFQHAVNEAPEQAMYQMMFGVALYNKAIDSARKEQAARANKKPEEFDPDLSGVNFSKPLQHLQEAVKLNSDLWRAHYYIGRIYRDTNESKKAAEALTKAVSYAPPEAQPWMALAELYRGWDYSKEALAVAQQGVNAVPGAGDKGDLLFVVGMANDDMRNDEKAIEAFDDALKEKPDHHKAKFQRGQAYFRKGDLAKAKKDLEEFSKAGGASLEYEKQQAQKMLLDIAAKSATQANTPTEKPSPEDLVKKGKG